VTFKGIGMAPANYVIRLLDLFLILLFYVCVCVYFCVFFVSVFVFFLLVLYVRF